MTQLGSSKHTVRRKEFRCHECNYMVNVGETYERGVTIYDGMMHNWKVCTICMDWHRAIFEHHRDIWHLEEPTLIEKLEMIQEGMED